MKTTKFLSLLLICLSIHFTTFADDWLNYTAENSELVNNSVSNIAQDTSGNMWFSSYASGTSKFDKTSTWTTYSTSSHLPIVYSMAIDKKNDVWFGGIVTMVKYEGDSIWKDCSDKGIFSSSIITSIMQSADNDMWFAKYSQTESEGGVTRMTIGIDTTWTTYTTANSGLVSGTVMSITQDKSGNMWFGTYAGVSKFDGTNWTNYTTTDGLVNDTVYSIFEDKDGVMWFGTETKGVSKFDGLNWTTYNPFNGNMVKSIIQDTNGNMWFATAGGLFMFDGNSTWINYTTSNSGLLNNYVANIIQDKDNSDLWIATGGGVSKFTLFSATPDTINISALATDTTISISTFKDWELMLPSSSSSWLSLSTTAGTGEAKTTLSILENTDITARTGKIYLMDSETGTIKQTIVVNQSFAVATNEVVNTHLTITPNPVKDVFQVSGLNGTATLSLTDINGKVVLSKEIIANESISVSSLPQGVYIVKLVTANGTVQQKLIKQ